MKLTPQQRQVEIRADMVDAAKRTVTFPFSSEIPVDRWFGTEVLDHAKSSVRLDRLNAGAPLLFNHRTDDVVGVVERAYLGDDKRGYATVRFAKTERADELLEMVNDKVLRNVSFMYRVHEFVEKSKGDEFRATDWEPMEVSIVAVPADFSVGIGRTQGSDEIEVRVVRASPQPALAADLKGASSMSEAQAAAGQGAADAAAVAAAAAAAAAGEQARGVQVTGMSDDKAAKLERAHASQLIALGEKNKVDYAIVRKWIDAGMSMDTAAEETLRVIEERGRLQTESAGRLGLTRQDTSKFSIMRAVQAVVDKNWQRAGFEAECSSAIASKLGKQPDPHKFYIPVEVQERSVDVHNAMALAQHLGLGRQQRDLTVATTTAGGFLVGTDNVGFIEIMRNRSIVFRMGARRLSGLVGNVSVPKQTGAATAYWLATEATAITESQQVFAQLLLSPKNVGAYTEISRQLLLQSSPSAESLVMADLAAVVAIAVDLAALEGSGASGQPTGISLTAGIGAVTGTTMAYAGIIEFQTDVAAANIMPARPGYVTTPLVAGKLMGRARFSNTDTPLWGGNLWDATMAGLPAAASNQLTADSMIFGDWDKLVVAEWGVLEVEVNPYANFPAGIVGIRAMYTVDVGVRYAAAFSRSTSIT